MAKNTFTTPIKDGIISDNTTWSSNKITSDMTEMAENASSLVIDDENISETTTFSSAKIMTFFAE